jgi:DNA-binding CsgD family transcriptional regulator
MPEAAAYGRTAEAEAARHDPDAWRGAANAWAHLGEQFHVAYCRLREAEAVLTARGSRKEAGAVLGEAREMAGGLGATGLLRWIDGLAQRARFPTGETPGERSAVGGAPEAVSPAEPMSGLTPRENEVLFLLSSGRTNRQIAEALFISERTVGVHVSRILRKLGVPNRGAAAHMFRASG